MGALTFCPECNSQDVFEVRKPGAGEPGALPVDDPHASFSQPRRAYRSSGAPPTPPPTGPDTLMLPGASKASDQTFIQQPAQRSDQTMAQFPRAAADTTMTQIPKLPTPDSAELPT